MCSVSILGGFPSGILAGQTHSLLCQQNHLGHLQAWNHQLRRNAAHRASLPANFQAIIIWRSSCQYSLRSFGLFCGLWHRLLSVVIFRNFYGFYVKVLNVNSYSTKQNKLFDLPLNSNRCAFITRKAEHAVNHDFDESLAWDDIMPRNFVIIYRYWSYP